MSRLLLVSNRVPWTLATNEGKGVLKPSSGGLATALAGTHARGETLWIGWPGDLINAAITISELLEARDGKVRAWS